MDIVYAVSNVIIPTPDGGVVSVRMGSHWPASDPIVRLQPGAFSSDPRYGLHYTAPFETADAGSDDGYEVASAAPNEKRGSRPFPTAPGGRRG